MNREDAKELWPIIKAFGDGEDVEWRSAGKDKWDPKSEKSGFTQSPSHYRIKPKPREFWVSAFRYSTDQTERHCFDGKPSFGTWIKVREVL